MERKDVFGQLIEESNLPNVAYKLGGLKIVRCYTKCYEFPSNPLVIVISPLRSIVEDQVKYSRSLGIQAAFLWESKTKDREILNG